MAQFPNHPMFRGFNRPVRIECEVFELEYEGRILWAAGPVAVVRLPLLMRTAFHGSGVPEAALERARVRQAPGLQ
jgi:hypothetical protein